MFFEAMHPAWQVLLADQKARLEAIEKALAELPAAEGSSEAYLPSNQNVMRAFKADPNQTRVLIIGQDPYPTPGHAIGLAFACPIEIRPQPRSLQNIRAELDADLAVDRDQRLHPYGADSVDLSRWANQGVMLLNRSLTVSPGKPGSHQELGWLTFTATSIERLAVLRSGALVTLLWGKSAQTVAPIVGSATLQAAHPSPLSARRGFFGSRPFSNANRLLVEWGQQPIDWFG
jgi:uracil-DNA glycosylase